MSYVGLINREYGSGRVTVFTDRIGGYRTGHGDNLLSFWRKMLEWVSQKNENELIKIAVIESTYTNYEKRLNQIENITFKAISLQDLATKDLSEFNILYFVGLPETISSNIPVIIASYVDDGMGLFIETPDNGGNYINILTSIDNIYCNSAQRPNYTRAYWTENSLTHYSYVKDALFYFMTTIEEIDVNSNWEKLITDVQVVFENEAENNVVLPEILTTGSATSEFGLSYISAMQKGLVEINEIISTESSESSSSLSTSSTSSVDDDFSWDICDDVLAHWKLNENYSNSFVWDSSGNLSHLGTLYGGILALNTSTCHTTGKINGAFLLDGISQYVSVNQNTSLNFTDGVSDEPFSISFWIYPSDPITTQVIAEKANVWRIRLNNNKIDISLFNGVNYKTYETLGYINSTRWWHVIILYDGTNFSSYINCASASGSQSSSGYTTMLDDNSYFYLGTSSYLLDNFNGKIDSFLIVSRELTVYEIEGLWNIGYGTEKCSGIYRFTSSSDSTLSSDTSSSIDSNSSTSSSYSSLSSLSSLSSMSSTSSIEIKSSSSSSTSSIIIKSSSSSTSTSSIIMKSSSSTSSKSESSSTSSKSESSSSTSSIIMKSSSSTSSKSESSSTSSKSESSSSTSSIIMKSSSSSTQSISSSSSSTDNYEYEQYKVFANDAEAGDLFSKYSVSICNDYAVVGSFGKNSNTGSTYIYHKLDTNTWDSGTKILSSDIQTGDQFGYSVSINGDYVVSGSPTKNSYRGAAYIFRRTGVNTWDSGTKIIASDSAIGDFFGYSVSINGDYAAIGAYEKDGSGTDRGAVYIFYRTGINTWDSGTKIISSDIQDTDLFGYSVSIYGDYVIVGAPLEDGSGTNRGAAYIFHRTGTNTWDSGTKIVASDTIDNGQFGISVSIYQDYCAIGTYASGPSSNKKVYIYHRTGTNTWGEEYKIFGYGGYNWGQSVSLYQDYLAISTSDEGNGTVRVFSKNEIDTWRKVCTIIQNDTPGSINSGNAICINKEYIIVSADEDNTYGTDSGSAYINYVYLDLHSSSSSIEEKSSSSTIEEKSSSSTFEEKSSNSSTSSIENMSTSSSTSSIENQSTSSSTSSIENKSTSSSLIEMTSSSSDSLSSLSSKSTSSSI